MRVLQPVPVLVPAELALSCLLLLLVPSARSSPVAPPPPLAPIRCAPCTPLQLSACPAVPARCPEVLREPGCGCCLACALSLGDACGVHTAPCGSGLRCTPRAGDPQPLHSLVRGQGACARAEITQQQQQQEEEDEEREDEEALMLIHNTVPTEESDLHSLHALLQLSQPTDTTARDAIRARANAIRKKLVQLGPCHTQLHAALDTIAASQQALGQQFTSFYLPNCDKHGFYKAKQCETSLMGQPPRCWCVSSWNGQRIAGTVDDLCQQEVTH
ncbi:insulin-like growth factor-binding protein 1 [Astyanax mexicanus]|uniref:Insulin-like growth factor-binding protein 1 n=1 Tax=Astyanax mexicanus TaxID=7994 RepID=A0A8T2LRW2_ASTMX|nr:insulin-like growth factor-binding protein 1 [Astyanax mexicanus]